jgi:hypothetical protein
VRPALDGVTPPGHILEQLLQLLCRRVFSLHICGGDPCFFLLMLGRKSLDNGDVIVILSALIMLQLLLHLLYQSLLLLKLNALRCYTVLFCNLVLQLEHDFSCSVIHSQLLLLQLQRFLLLLDDSVGLKTQLLKLSLLLGEVRFLGLEVLPPNLLRAHNIRIT